MGRQAHQSNRKPLLRLAATRDRFYLGSPMPLLSGLQMGSSPDHNDRLAPPLDRLVGMLDWLRLRAPKQPRRNRVCAGEPKIGTFSARNRLTIIPPHLN